MLRVTDAFSVIRKIRCMHFKRDPYLSMRSTQELNSGSFINHVDRNLDTFDPPLLCINMDNWQTPLPPAMSTWLVNAPSTLLSAMFQTRF